MPSVVKNERTSPVVAESNTSVSAKYLTRGKTGRELNLREVHASFTVYNGINFPQRLAAASWFLSSFSLKDEAISCVEPDKSGCGSQFADVCS